MARQKDPAAVALGRRGGKARLKKMTAEQRKAVASLAALKRWENKTAKQLQRSNERMEEYEKRSRERNKKIQELLKIAKGEA